MVKYIPLGGVGTTANKNLHVYETETDILIVDCGVAFPDADQLGVDVVIPDIDYLEERADKIRGIIITHAHFDHYGALPYVLRRLRRPPIYAAKLPRGFIQKELVEHDLLEGQSLHLIEPEKDPVLQLGEFTITPYRVNHSVPDTIGLFINTKDGNIVHNTDFKFDWTPVDGKLFEIGKLAALSQEGVMCMMSDSLGAARSGYTMSERDIKFAFEREIQDARKQVIITTMSSNISRMQQAIEVAVKYKRKVIPLGRSIEENMEVARNLGYIDVPKGVIVSADRARRLKPHQRMFIAAGSFGQPNSALMRLATGTHRNGRIKPDDVVIFSADPIPGVHDQVDKAIDLLTQAGAKVVYSDLADDLHTSGHGSQGDMSILAGVVRPDHFVPIGGTYQHMRAYKNLMEAMGFDPETVHELGEGEIIVFRNGEAKIEGHVQTKNVFVDGSLVGDVGRVVIEDRQKLAEEGIFVVIIKKNKDGTFSRDLDVVSRGFVYMAESEELVNEALGIAVSVVDGKSASDWSKVRDTIEQKLSNFFYRNTQRKPMILPVLVDV